MTAHTPALSDDQIHQYWRDGYVYGIPILTPKQMSIARKKLIDLEGQELEKDPIRWSDPEYQPWMEPGNPWWHWFQGMVRHPTLIAAVQDILGPNVLVRNADIFVKPVGSEETIQWHTDTTAPDADADKMLTAWLAISDSSSKNGCMEWLTGSHREALPPEVKDKHSLSFNKKSAKAARKRPRQPNILEPGQLSLHHFRTIHRSQYNRTKSPRIGLVIRFMASSTPIEVAESGKGMLVAGSNLPGHFMAVPCFHVSWRREETTQLSEQAKPSWIG